MRIRAEEGEENSKKFINFFLFLYASISLLSIIIVIILNPTSVFAVFSNFDQKDILNNDLLLYLSLPLFASISVINLLSDVLVSYKFFTIPMFVGIINASLSILFVLLFHDFFGISIALIGLTVSYTVNLLLLAHILKKKLKWRFSSISFVRDRRIWKNFAYANLGNFTGTAASYAPLFILSGFNAGIITALTFAQQISSLPTTLITYQFSSVAGIKFNELYAKREFSEIKKTFSESSKFLHYAMIPISCFVFFFADPIANIFSSFISLDQNASEYFHLFLKYLILLLPLHILNTLIARLLMASHRIGESFWYQALSNLVLIILLATGVQLFGIIGYPLAMLATYIANLGGCYIFKKRYFDFLDYKGAIKDLSNLAIVNSMIGLLTFYIIHSINIINPWYTVTLAGSSYILLLAIISTAFGIGKPILSTFNTLFKNRRPI